MEDEGERIAAAGMDAHLLKPITLEALAATLARWIEPAAPDGGTEERQLS
jgi:hypothetical protein